MLPVFHGRVNIHWRLPSYYERSSCSEWNVWDGIREKNLLISIFSFRKFSPATFSFLAVSLERNILLCFGTRCLTQSFSGLYLRVAGGLLPSRAGLTQPPEAPLTCLGTPAPCLLDGIFAWFHYWVEIFFFVCLDLETLFTGFLRGSAG